jgi:protocatechuate 3,4-dioxygenase beta subunit
VDLWDVKAVKLDYHTNIDIPYFPLGEITITDRDLNRSDYEVEISSRAVVRVRALDSGKKPVPNAVVVLSRLAGEETTEVHERTTDAQGSCAFYGIAPGSYEAGLQRERGRVVNITVLPGREEFILLPIK